MNCWGVPCTEVFEFINITWPQNSVVFFIQSPCLKYIVGGGFQSFLEANSFPVIAKRASEIHWQWGASAVLSSPESPGSSHAWLFRLNKPQYFKRGPTDTWLLLLTKMPFREVLKHTERGRLILTYLISCRIFFFNEWQDRLVWSFQRVKSVKSLWTAMWTNKKEAGELIIATIPFPWKSVVTNT